MRMSERERERERETCGDGMSEAEHLSVSPS